MARVKRTREEIGTEIRRLRKENHMTQVSLGMQLHVDQSKISKLESGTDLTLDFSIIVEICEIFKISLDELFFIIDDEAEKDGKRAHRIIRNLESVKRNTVMDMLNGLECLIFLKIVVIKILSSEMFDLKICWISIF